MLERVPPPRRFHRPRARGFAPIYGQPGLFYAPEPQVIVIEREVFAEDETPDLGDLSPAQQTLRNFALAGVAGAWVGKSLARRHPLQSALLGATAVMMLYGVAKEGVGA